MLFRSYGVVGAGMVVGAWYFFRSGLPAKKVADLMVPWHAFGHFLQNFGCLAAGCHFGDFTGLPWGIFYSHPIFAGPRGFALHPFPIYVALVAITGGFTAYGWVKIKYFERRAWISFYRKYLAYFLRVRFVEGELFPLAGIYYSVGRFLAEFTRNPSLQIWYPNWPLPQSQMACVFIFFFSLLGLLCLWAYDDSKKGKTEHDWWLKHLLKMLEGMEWLAKRVPWPARP